MIFREVVFLSSGLPRPVVGNFKKPNPSPPATRQAIDRYLLNSGRSDQTNVMTTPRPSRVPSLSGSFGRAEAVGSGSASYAFPVPYPHPDRIPSACDAMVHGSG